MSISKPTLPKQKPKTETETKTLLDWQGEGSQSNDSQLFLLSSPLYFSSKLKPREACFPCRVVRSIEIQDILPVPGSAGWEVSGINGQAS